MRNSAFPRRTEEKRYFSFAMKESGRLRAFVDQNTGLLSLS